MAEYASKGIAGAGLGTGIAGLALGVLNGGLGNLLTGVNGGCSEDRYTTRYEAGQSARIAELETEVKLRDANTYTLTEMGKLRDYMDHRFDRVEHELCDQKVFNATAISNLSCVQSQVAQLMGLTKMIVPITNVCPEPMPQFNSFTVPTAST